MKISTLKRRASATHQAMQAMTLLIGLLGMLFLSSCSQAKDSGGEVSDGGTAGGSTVIDGSLRDCLGDSIRLYQRLGGDIKQIAAAPITREGSQGNFSLSTTLPSRGFFLIGEEPRRAANILLAGPGKMTLTGSCQNPNGMTLSNNPEHEAYQRMVGLIQAHNQNLSMLTNNLRLFQMSDPNQVPRIQQEIAEQNRKHFAALDSIEALGGIVGDITHFYNFKPADLNPKSTNYPNELEYFAGEFFADINFADPDIAKLPLVMEKAQAFSANLSQGGLSREKLLDAMNTTLGRLDQQSPAYASMLKGFVQGLDQVKSDLYIEMGKRYMQEVPGDAFFNQQLQRQIAQYERTRVGGPAPDISQPDPSGKMVALSDFRGKYVLVDFWASWCRPCRMENPNVVAAYQKYHPRGFEILGVSLDQSKEKWEAAIAQDGLPWKHMSDLKGWGSGAAATYGVNSIPATVLVGPDGTIIAKNLRGPALEQKLAEIYGI